MFHQTASRKRRRFFLLRAEQPLLKNRQSRRTLQEEKMKQVAFTTSSGSPDNDAWHAWRAQHLGASDAPVIAAGRGLCSKPSWARALHALWLEKTGQLPPQKSNFAMNRGRQYEETARLAYEAKTGEMVSPCFGECEPFPQLSASFDGMSLDGNTIVEIKVPSAKVHEMAKNGQVVDYYVPQIAHQALVAWGMPESWGNDKRAFFVSYDPDKDELVIVPVDMGELAMMPTPTKSVNASSIRKSTLLSRQFQGWRRMRWR
jgi:putative phage-type endonuclease